MELQDKTLKLKFDNSYNGRLFAVQGDTGRVFNLQVLSDMDNVLDVSGMKLRLYIGSNKEVTYTDGEITSPEEGKFKVLVYNSQLKYPGLQKAQFILTDKDGQKIGSKVFDLYIEEGLEMGTSLGKNILVDFETIDEALKLIRNYDKTLEEAKEVDLKLKVDIQEGTETREALADCKKKALEIKGQLETSKTDASKTLNDLNATKTESETLKSNLASENVKTGKNIQTLTEKTETGNETIAGLGQSIEKAIQTDTILKSTDTEAKATEGLLRDLLAQIGATEEEVRRIIASGDLDQYITDPKLQEALKAYATKEDLKGIDVTEQLKDYAKTVDVTSALENKVDVKDGYGLSQNDYTNEDKAKVDVLSEKETEWTKLQEWKNHIIDKSNYKEVLDFSKASLINNTDGIHLRPVKIKYVPNKKFYEEFTQMKEPVQIGIFFPEEAIAGIPTQFTIYFSNKGSLTFWYNDGFRSFGSKCAVVDVSQHNPDENKNVKSKIIQVVPPNHIHSFRFEMMTGNYDPFQNGVSIVYTTLP